MKKYNRQSGVLLHPTALPGSHGIGDIGSEAYRFIDHLADMEQSLWQILPLGPTDIYNSPYSSASTFAGNYMLISLDILIEDGLLDKNNIMNIPLTNRINFVDVSKYKKFILDQVSKDFNKKASDEIKNSFNQFCIDNSYWLDDYSLYTALKEINDQKSWFDWKIKETNDPAIIYKEKIIQFLFHEQWQRLRKYSNDKGIKIIGDMPIYIGYDSSDIYFNQDLFQLDNNGKMLFQAGCPPCEYQSDGQIWGNPLYSWEVHEHTNFDWWKKRFKKLFDMVDIIRIDHFIGYAKYFRIPITDKVANNGRWLNASGEKLFNVLESSINNFDIFVEDLGDISESVINLREKYNYAGMNVLQFDLNNLAEHKKIIKNSILYTGTHDNDTLLGWYQSYSNKSDLLDYFKSNEKNIIWDIIKYAFNSESKMVIIPFQDLVGLDNSARFNIPGTLSKNNWSWRMNKEYINERVIDKLFKISNESNRNN